MKKELFKRMSAAFVLALGLGLVIYGIVSGEAERVLQKAITICLECIGIG